MPSNNEMRQGWGIAFKVEEDGSPRLYASDGSDRIFVIDPVDWNQKKSLKVRQQNGQLVQRINELEIIQTSELTRKYIFANLFETSMVVMINLETGVVVKSWNLDELLA